MASQSTFLKISPNSYLPRHSLFLGRGAQLGNSMGNSGASEESSAPRATPQ